jgi:uncharacterized membrane protein
MLSDAAIFLAAAGITTLEISEAAAVGLALYGHSKKAVAFLYVALGILAVLIPTLVIGSLISLLPVFYVRLVGGILLLYFGIRLAKSARRSVVRSKTTGFSEPEFERGIMATGFSIGAVEAFEASIVLVGLLPNSYLSTTLGIAVGIAIVVVATFVLRAHVRKVKQADMKILVSALLLSFSAFWFGESVLTPSDLLLIPLFLFFVVVVYEFANRKIKQATKLGPQESLEERASAPK